MDRHQSVIASRSQDCEILMIIQVLVCRHPPPLLPRWMRQAASDNRAMPAPTSAWSRRHQSGELDWTGRITKQGDGTVRNLLYKAANSILTRSRKTFALKTWAMKIARRSDLKKARVAFTRRLGVIMHDMLRDSTLF